MNIGRRILKRILKPFNVFGSSAQRRSVTSVVSAPVGAPASTPAFQTPNDAHKSGNIRTFRRRSNRSKTERNRKSMLERQQAIRRARGQNHRSGKAA